MAARNPYLVTKALNSYLKGSVIIAISGHLVTTSDAVMVSWLIGSKAFTAVNIVIPILTVFSALMIMISIGASVSVSKSLGLRASEKVNLSFSSSVTGALILGVAAAVVTYKFSSDIVKELVKQDGAIFRYALEYLKIFCYAVPSLIVAGVLSNIVRADGNTRLVTVAVAIGIVVNVVLDIVFIRFLNMGIGGAAWATLINYLLVVLICLMHFVSADNTVKWSLDVGKYFMRFIKNCKLGFSTSLNTLLSGVSLFVINSIMLPYQGNEGLYCWAVCYQIFLILQMLLSGIDSSIFALGSTILGEDDVNGLEYLYKRSAVYLIISVLALSASIILFPEFYGNIFGNRGEDRLDLLPSVLKIFSLFLFPYAMVMQVRSVYTILGRGALSLFFCVISFILMTLLVYLACVTDFNPVWWGFPVSSWVLFVGLIIYTGVIHLMHGNLRMYSLIPKSVPDPMFSDSVVLNSEAVEAFEQEASGFLLKQHIEEPNVKFVVDVITKVTDEIETRFQQTFKKKKFMDVNLRIKGSRIIAILRDNGKRIDRQKEENLYDYIISENKERDTTKEVSSSTLDFSVSYFYMNEQNTFTLIFSHR